MRRYLRAWMLLMCLVFAATAGPVRTYRALPALPGPVVLDDWRFSIVRPVARTNLILNPSVETNTTGYTAVGGSVARSTTYAYHGAYSLAITPTAATTDGVYYTTSALVSGSTYGISVKVKGDAGRPYRLAVASNAGTVIQTQAFTGTGFWQWVTLLHTATASATHRIYIAKNGGTQTSIFYMDGLQLELCAANEYFVTTYIDGDQLGLLGAVELPPFYWTGTPHASTSVRSGQTRAGGRVIPLSAYGYVVTNVQGLGMAPVQQITTPFAQLDGSQYLDTRKTDRGVTFSGRWLTRTPYDRQRKMAALAADLDRDLIATRQPLTILAEPLVEGRPIRAPLVIPALSYVDGLSGSLDGLPTGESIIAFTQYQPRINGGDTGATLTPRMSLTQDLWQRNAAGVWSWVGGAVALPSSIAATATPLALALTPDGYLYIGGTGTSLAGIAGADHIVRIRDGTYSIVGGASGATVRALAVAPTGNLVLAGDFTTVNSGGVAANRIALWDGSVYTALGTGLNGLARAVVVDRLNNVYVGGDFTLAGGVANTVRIAKWDGSVWTPLSTGANGNVYALALGLDGTTLYAGGQFSTLGGVTVNGVGKWDGSVWTSMGGGVTGGAADVFALAVAPNGMVYAGGDFTTAGAIAALNIAVWNGVQWSALGSGVSDDVNAIAINPQNGFVYAGGLFASAGGVNSANLALWNGSAWARSDAGLSVTYPITTLAYKPDGTLIVGTAITAPPQSFSNVGAVTTVTSQASVSTYPTLVIYPPSGAAVITISQLLNTSSQTFIYINTTARSGEVITLVLDPARFSYRSSTRGNIINEILPGSDIAGWVLQPGANTVSFLASDAGTVAVLYWPNDLASLEDGWTK
jgi:hypothetical protein